ncbi:unnamed protein product [Leptidea sinapis]|uniref:Gamma-interferon-inducible lysosomal thiol reductase n=1 Tax=Leptidea sinapis TaxID=189913 RepID=A0A5E4QX84_9NEOP|nr:unnamed protein product [Leptidea sinapis]
MTKALIVLLGILFYLIQILQALPDLNNHRTAKPETLQSKVAQHDLVTKKVPIKIYYETLCPASVDFFINDLGPAVELLEPHINVLLVPYGHAETWPSRGSYKFNCQHGSDECHGNRIHACAIHEIQNNSRAAIFNVCLMTHTLRRDNRMDFFTALNLCGNQMSVNSISEIWNCAVTSRGALLLKNYGEETKRVRPRYVPHVTYGEENQIFYSGNLTAAICDQIKIKPQVCQY